MTAVLLAIVFCLPCFFELAFEAYGKKHNVEHARHAAIVFIGHTCHFYPTAAHELAEFASLSGLLLPLAIGGLRSVIAHTVGACPPFFVTTTRFAPHVFFERTGFQCHLIAAGAAAARRGEGIRTRS